MSAFLWKYLFEDDLEGFRHILASANYVGTHTKASAANSISLATLGGSPGHGLTSSPTLKSKGKARKGTPTVTISRVDINSRNEDGATLLHCLASSTSSSAFDFASALLEVPLLDLYIQDLENGWTALHRALYHGNTRLAQALMDRDVQDYGSLGTGNAGGLIKIKDREGNSPFDLYGTTIASREIGQKTQQLALPGGEDGSTDASSEGTPSDIPDGRLGNVTSAGLVDIGGDDLFTFGSNKNLNLGVGNEDDRHFPEKISLSRPPCLVNRLNTFSIAHQTDARSRATRSSKDEDLDDVPTSIKFKPVVIQDVRMAKYHTAILTSDPEANLYVCGFGPGGRLGTGDTSTRFRFTSVLGGGLARRKIVAVGLGQNHTLAVTDRGEVYSWGSNAYGQLGLTSPTLPPGDEDPVQLLPRQIFGALKRETIVGCAASALHSVVFSTGSLYTFGKNEGQLGLVDANAASLQVQATPRKVAASLFSSAITMVSAIDRATVCLLESREVWVFANYGYCKVAFPFDVLPSEASPTFICRARRLRNAIIKICSGGDTVCSLNSQGEVFTVAVGKEEPSKKASTTNPNKIRGLLSPAQRVWSLRKSHMAAQDVDVSQAGSVVICTKAGSVWRRMKRAKIQDPDSKDGLVKDYKYSRIPGLSRVSAVRGNDFGAFAAIRKEDGVLKTQIHVSPSTLWQDLAPLLPFSRLRPSPSFSSSTKPPLHHVLEGTHINLASIRVAVASAKDVESDLARELDNPDKSDQSTYDVRLRTTTSELRIPCHEFVLAARSPFLKMAFYQFRQKYFFTLPGVFSIEYDSSGEPLVCFHGIDILTLLNLIFFAYTDGIIDVWSKFWLKPLMANRYRQVRAELTKVAARLELKGLEQAARLMVEPAKLMHQDFSDAIVDPTFFETADIEIQLDGASMKAHSSMLSRRCAFFEGLFFGHAAGGWVRSRREDLREPAEAIKVDMKHVDPRIFKLVLRHIYADASEEVFEDAKVATLDELLDLVMDVLSVANELMLDRFAEICQMTLAKYTNMRNICQLLNAVAPCSVTKYKHAALEYICLNLESMLENRLLSELDEDLMADLDAVVQANQLAAMPIAKGKKLESDLLEIHPELAEAIEMSRQAKVAAMLDKYRLREDAVKMSKSGRRGSEVKTRSPKILPKRPSTEMVFEMDDMESDDDEESNRAGTKCGGFAKGLPTHNSDEASMMSPLPIGISRESGPESLSPASSTFARSSSHQMGSLSSLSPLQKTKQANLGTSEDQITVLGSVPWAAKPLVTPKLDMRQIMAQASAHQESNISAAISKEQILNASTGIRLSQKERKRLFQIQQQSHQSAGPSSTTPDTASPKAKGAPWQTVTRSTRVSLKDVLNESKETAQETAMPKARVPSTPALTLRQTVPGNANASRRCSTESPSQSRHAGPQCSVSGPATNTATPGPPSAAAFPPPPASPRAPRSVRHAPPAAEPSLQLSMADILAQQQTEKDVLHEVKTARRSLREIQEEQAFQEWWNQEEAATRARMEAEEERSKAASASASKRSGRGGRRSRGMRRGRGGGRSNDGKQ